MNRFAKVELRVDAKAITQKLEGAIDDDVRQFAHASLDKISQPYIPMDQGALSQSGRATAESLLYPGPYAHYQWAGLSKKGNPFNYRKDRHPLATSHWEEAAMQTNMETFLGEIKQFIEKRNMP